MSSNTPRSDSTECNRTGPGLGQHRHRWMYDWASPWEYTAHAVRREIHHAASAFQEIEIVETEGWGRCLLLDGEVQSFEVDEYVYHESLVHPAMLLVPDPGPRSVLVIGGGEGATLREVLRHPGVEQVTMVDLDRELIAAARVHLPRFHAGSFDDPRVRLEFGDGRAFVEQSRAAFDVIVIDVTNPMEGGPSYRLFTVEFYRAVAERLRDGGIVALQSDAVTLGGMGSAATIHHTVRAVWPNVCSYAVFLPAYATEWSFTIAGSRVPSPVEWTPAAVAERLARRSVTGLRYYDGVTHRRMFHLPAYVRQALGQPSTVSRDDQPLIERFPGWSRGQY